MLLLNLDRKNKIPLFKQIFNQLKEMINSNTLMPGDKLPSTRSLAYKLSVNRTTVFKAYEELRARGYTHSSSGSYTTVRKRAQLVKHRKTNAKEIIDWDKIFTPDSKMLTNSLNIHKPGKAKQNQIDFVSLSPDLKLMPVQDFRLCMNHMVKTKGLELLNYGDPKGFGPLRNYIADQMRQHSVSVTYDEIIITCGS